MPRCVKTAHVFEKKWRSDDVRLQEEATFSSLLLPKKILMGLQNAGFKTPSPIQLESIPVGRFGRDLLVQAKSGTGKTLVFTVIALETLTPIKYPQVLIMAPTREIAIQICDVVRAVGSAFKGLTCNCFIGGIAVDSDIERVHGCQIVVGTPGRLKHLISLGILPTNSIRLLVLDEADVLLDSNFKDDLDFIFLSLPKEKQVIATSATYPKELRMMTRRYFRKAYLARINRTELSLLGMVHYTQVLELSKMSLLAYKNKLAALEKVVTSVQFTQCLVFCNLISRVEALCYDIRNWGFTSTFISSAKEQCDRIRAIECLKRFKCKILVTSDITSRGIDAENVDLVINFDKPSSSELYFHRCGRAGRYGAKGVAITFLEKGEVVDFQQMQVNHYFKAYNLPDPIPANLINIRPTECNSSVENSEDEGLSDVPDENSNDLNNHPCDTTNTDKITNDTNSTNPSSLSNNENKKILSADTNCKSSAVSDSINKTNENCENNVLSDLNTKNNKLVFKSDSVENQTEGTGNAIIEVAAVAITAKEKNSFLEYLENGPNNTESASVSNSSVVLNVSESSNNEVLLEDDNNKGAQNESLNSSEEHCLDNKNNRLETDNGENNSKVSIFDENKEDNKDSSNVTEVKSNEISVDNSIPTVPNASASVKVSDEAIYKSVPNKIQLSVGKFLIEHNLKSQETNLSSTVKGSSDDKKYKATALKDIHGDLSDFYFKVYKAYQAENITDSAFEDIKAVVIQQKEDKIISSANTEVSTDEVKNSEEKIDEVKNSEEKIEEVKNCDEKIEEGSNVENCQNLTDLKVEECDNSLYSIVSNEYILLEENNRPETESVVTGFRRILLKNDSEENSSDSSHDENPYLSLAKSFDLMQKDNKSQSKKNLPASKKGNKNKCIQMKKATFSKKNGAVKKQHSPPVNFEKLSDSKSSDLSSDSVDSENELQKELSGARKKVHKEKRHYQGENSNRPKNKNKVSYKAWRQKEKPNMTFSEVSETSENLHSQYAHTSTPHFKESMSANVYDHTTSTNGGNMPSTSCHHGHTTSAANYGNMPSLNLQHGCTTSAEHYENYPMNHQFNGYGPKNYAPKRGNISCGGQTRQLRSECCHNCSTGWHQTFVKQWQFIESSLF